jgi:hypothetical protein
VEEPALDYAVPVDATPEDLAIDSVYSYDDYPCSINCNDVRSHTCFRGLPRRFFSCVLPVARPPAAACLPAFDGSSLSLPFPPFCVCCARSRALYLVTKALAFPVQIRTPMWDSIVPNNAVYHRRLHHQ